MLVVAAVTPMSLVALIAGTIARRNLGGSALTCFALGIHFLFVFIVACTFVFKVLLGATI
jgi:hypothetical protein